MLLYYISKRYNKSTIALHDNTHMCIIMNSCRQIAEITKIQYMFALVNSLRMRYRMKSL